MEPLGSVSHLEPHTEALQSALEGPTVKPLHLPQRWKAKLPGSPASELPLRNFVKIPDFCGGLANNTASELW